jgi:hypothetical protein
MKCPVSIVFSRNKEYRYGLIIDKYQSYSNKFNLKNHYTSTLARLVLPTVACDVTQKFRQELISCSMQRPLTPEKRKPFAYF